MTRLNPAITSFNAGEWSPLMYGQVGLAKYPSACRRMENMLATVQGPAKRRGGTRFIAFQKDSSLRAWLGSFRFSAAQAYLLEFAPGYVRFFTARSQLTSGGVPYEVSSPYTAGDLTTDDATFGVNFEQAGDVVYLAGGARFPQKLTRFGATNWTLSEHRTVNGPLQDVNPNESLRLKVSGQTGSIQVIADAAVFDHAHVGMLIRVDLENVTIAPWEPGKAPESGARRRSDGKTYLAIDANGVTKTGTQTPVHESGIVWDGSGFTTDSPPVPIGIQWQFEDAGYGIGRITGYVSQTEVIVSVESPFPFNLTYESSNVWQIGAFGAAAEYPQHVARYKNRLAYAGARKVHLGVPGAFDDFARDIVGEVRDDAGITRELDSTDAITWMRAAAALLIGTESTELVAQKQTQAEPLSPKNFDSDPKSAYGSRRLRPEPVGAGMVMVDKAGRRIRLLSYAEDQGYQAPDITVLCEHITRGGVVDWAFQKQPDRILWAVLADGSLIGLTVEMEQQVLAAHRHPTDGKVLAVETLPSPDGTRDDVWLIVERTLGGSARRCIELMDKGRDAGEPLAESFFVDCGRTYRGPAVAKVPGFDHLAGRSVAILADGASVPRQVVASDGTVTLRYPASVVHVGLPMRSLIEPMTLTPGSVPGKTESAPIMQALLFETVGGKVGSSEKNLRPIGGRNPATPDGDPQPLLSDWVEVAVDSSPGRRASLIFVQDEPLPMTLCALTPEVEKNART